MAMDIHVLTREYEGCGEQRVITLACSCGWRSIGYVAHNDYQMTLVRQQETDHLRAFRRQNSTEA
jgi:hypothetical protein